MAQQRALNALEPFIALSKSASSSRAAADLVSQAISAPQTYVFAELLETPNIQKLRDSSDHAQHLKLLEIFAWGTYGDYQFLRSSLPDLTEAQTQKLRLLSLLTLLPAPTAPSEPTALTDSALETSQTYSSLMQPLSLDNTQAFESLVTSAISLGLLTGHLDPLHQRLAITSVAPLRDMPPHSAKGMIRVLDEWSERCTDTLREIESRIKRIRDSSIARRNLEAQRQRTFDEALDRHLAQVAAAAGPGMSQNSQAHGIHGAGRGGKRAAPMAAADDVDEMDVDDEGVGGDGRRTSKGKGTKKVFSKMMNMR